MTRSASTSATPSQLPPPWSAESVRGVAATTFIAAFFGLFWGFTGTTSLPPPFDTIGLLVIVAITLGLFAVALVLYRRARRLPSVDEEQAANPFRTRAYTMSVALMVIAIPSASFVLRATGFADAIVPVIAVVVGLHFFGLVRAFDSRRFALIGGAMCLVGVLALGLPVRLSLDAGASIALRETVVGIGCALVLWVSVLGTVLPLWGEAGYHATQGPR